MKPYISLPYALVKAVKENYFNVECTPEQLSFYNDRLKELERIYSVDLVKEAIRQIKNTYARIRRYRKAISWLCATFPYVYFGTLTLSNKFYDRDSFNYTSRYLKKHYTYYILNDDLGEETSRFHYHFIAGSFLPVSFEWKRGFYFVENVRVDDKDRLANYTIKLTLHSFKCGVQNIVYARRNICELGKLELQAHLPEECDISTLFEDDLEITKFTPEKYRKVFGEKI